MQRKADMGIGTLIIFIAMILVAAIAAAVLIQTATTLQNKALLTGERSKSQVSTSMMPVVAYAEDGSDNNDVDLFYIKAKLVPGSDAIKLSETLLEFSLKDTSADLTYSTDHTDCTNAVDVKKSNATVYYAAYLIQGDSYKAGYVQRGDVVEICFQAPRNVTEDESLSMTLVPKTGSPSNIETALPDIITEKRIVIYP